VREKPPQNQIWFRAGASAFFVVLFWLLLSVDMRKELNHDEHQFIAAGALASQSLIPYKDYPYTQTPYLAFIYAAMFKHTGYLLLSGRAFSTACEFAAIVLVFSTTSKLFKDGPHVLRFFIAAGAAMLLFTNPLFASTTGFAWNHAAPELCTLAAFVLQSHGVNQQRGTKWVFLSGILLGLAAGIRVTYALAIIPVGSLILLSPSDARAKLPSFLSLAAGVALGMLPALSLLILYPQRFIFDVIRYPQLDTMWRREIGYTEAMAISARLVYFISHVFRDPGNVGLGFSFVLSTLALITARTRARPREKMEALAILVLIPFLLIGSFVKAPTFYQYFYAPVPFLVLGIAYMIASMGARGMRLLPVVALAVVVSTVYGLPQYLPVRHLLSFDAWVPLQAHQLGAVIRGTAGAGLVLTLAPIFPLEGGAKIYRGLAAASFTWRSAHLLPKAERAKVGIVSPDDLDRLVKDRAPAAVLVGLEFEEGDLERPLTAYAKLRGYKRLSLSNGAELWVAPEYAIPHRGTEALRTDGGIEDTRADRCYVPP
jgi:hypothetical protein